MRFFDCNCCIGLPANPPSPTAGVSPGVSAGELLAAMDRAGIDRALPWHVGQHDQDPLTGNELLAEAIAAQERLVGGWSLLPPQTGELGDVGEWFQRAASAGVRACRAFPEANRYLLRAEVFEEVFEAMTAARWPLLLSLARGVTWDQVYDLLGEFPELTVILCDHGSWGADRYFRPLLQRRPNVYVEIGGYTLDGGIEDFVARYGPGRMLFGSNFPACYHGGMMLALAHAEISDADKQAIAAGNLERLLGEVKL